MNTSKEHALELFPRDVDALIADIGLPAFAGKQVIDWIYKKQVTSVDEMTNISKEKRLLLEERLFFRRSKCVKPKKHPMEPLKNYFRGTQARNRQKL